MFQKGRKRESKGLAVLYFIIGLIILLIILGIIYFALVKLDYSDQVADGADGRAYVAATAAAADDVILPEDDEGELDDDDLFAGAEDGTDVEATAEPNIVRATAEPTPTPEPTPEPTPTPSPTPEPTAIPAEAMNAFRTKGYTVRNSASENGVIGITDCKVSEPNNNQVMYLAGYGYVNTATFDGSRAKSFMIITQRTTGKTIAYELTMSNGISGLTHTAAECANPAACDYSMYVDVSSFPDDIYTLALVITYQPANNNKTSYAYYPFSSDVSFTVLNGQVVTPVATVNG